MNRRLDEDQVLEVYRLLDEGELTTREIAGIVGVSQPTVSRAMSRRIGRLDRIEDLGSCLRCKRPLVTKDRCVFCEAKRFSNSGKKHRLPDRIKREPGDPTKNQIAVRKVRVRLLGTGNDELI